MFKLFQILKDVRKKTSSEALEKDVLPGVEGITLGDAFPKPTDQPENLEGKKFKYVKTVNSIEIKDISIKAVYSIYNFMLEHSSKYIEKHFKQDKVKKQKGSLSKVFGIFTAGVSGMFHIIKGIVTTVLGFLNTTLLKKLKPKIIKHVRPAVLFVFTSIIYQMFKFGGKQMVDSLKKWEKEKNLNDNGKWIKDSLTDKQEVELIKVFGGETIDQFPKEPDENELIDSVFNLDDINNNIIFYANATLFLSKSNEYGLNEAIIEGSPITVRDFDNNKNYPKYLPIFDNISKIENKKENKKETSTGFNTEDDGDTPLEENDVKEIKHIIKKDDLKNDTIFKDDDLLITGAGINDIDKTINGDNNKKIDEELKTRNIEGENIIKIGGNIDKEYNNYINIDESNFEYYSNNNKNYQINVTDEPDKIKSFKPLKSIVKLLPVPDDLQITPPNEGYMYSIWKYHYHDKGSWWSRSTNDGDSGTDKYLGPIHTEFTDGAIIPLSDALDSGKVKYIRKYPNKDVYTNIDNYNHFMAKKYFSIYNTLNSLKIFLVGDTQIEPKGETAEKWNYDKSYYSSSDMNEYSKTHGILDTISTLSDYNVFLFYALFRWREFDYKKYEHYNKWWWNEDKVGTYEERIQNQKIRFKK